MRWQRLFEDLEAQLEQEAAAELRAEVADRTRAEQADVWLADRLRAAGALEVALHLRDGAVVAGRVDDAAPEWVVLAEARGQALVPLASVASVAGLPRRVAPPAGEVLRRTSLRTALRALARDRAAVRVAVAGAELAGTIDRVAGDHVDLALHAPGEPRRAGAVLEVRAVAIGALLAVRSA
ncbi:hypothetical protein WDV85_00120 [Pseudokineococcus sp. 5B2Z-1]|uniref:hypothetical protein n=1 Tax=Pseudokineococcus sp. 5B2Z-1 TaxID=3132744 RepID=UPI0030A117AC